MEPGRVRTLLRTTVRLVLGTALALAAFEPIARIYYHYPGTFEPGVGPVPAAGQKVRWCLEGCAQSTWQAHGVRRTRPVDPHLPVVLAVGDSHTEALHVGDDEVFTARLERALGDGTQVVNVGRSGESAADYVGLAGRNRELFAPRWTLVILKDKDFEGVGGGPYRFVRAGEELAVAPNPLPAASTRFDAVRRYVALYSFIGYRLHQLGESTRSEPPLFFAGAPIKPPPLRRPVGSAREILAALDRAYDGRVTFVYLSHPEPAHLEAAPTEREFDGACAELAASCVNPRTAFQALVDAGTPPYGFANSTPNSGHLNPAGHAALAAELAKELSHLALL
jgi:lysophospholipase L1-like esterase